jgi:hypothetical protein
MLFKSLDIYCERVDASFWSEPVNALTNIFIFLAGFFGYKVIFKLGQSSGRKQGLIAASMAMVTGCGSFLFHTFANVLTMWLDVIPIILFQIFSINFYLQYIFKRKLLFRVFFLVVFVGLSLYLQTEKFNIYFNGSMLYFPSIVTLIIFGFLCLKQKIYVVGKYTLVGVSVFIISISARSMDMRVCDTFPLGTHFIWHSLNGVLIFCLLFSIFKYLELQEK